MMKDKRAVWCLAVGQTLVWAGIYYIFPALIVRWEAEFGWSRTEITAALTIAILASAACSPISGRLIDKGYGPRTLFGGAFIGGLLVTGLFFVNSLPVFYLIWAGLGICMAFSLYEPCFSFIIRTKGLAAKRYITIITLVAGLASTISFPLAYAISEAVGWRIAILTFVGLVSFIGAPLMWYGANHLHEDESAAAPKAGTASSSGKDRYGFLKWPKFWLVAFAFALIAMTHATLINHLLLLLKDRQFDAGTAVLAASFMGPMQVAGRLSAIVAERFFSNSVVAVLCFIFSLAAVLALMAATWIPAFLAVFIILQGSGIGVVSIMKPIVTREILGGENFGLKSGAQAVPYFVGSAFAAFLGSLLWSVGGYDLVLRVLLFVLLAGMGALVFAMRLDRKDTAR